MATFNQLERLRRDSRKLGNYIHKLHKRGNSNKAHHLARKQLFLDSALSEVESRVRRWSYLDMPSLWGHCSLLTYGKKTLCQHMIWEIPKLERLKKWFSLLAKKKKWLPAAIGSKYISLLLKTWHTSVVWSVKRQATGATTSRTSKNPPENVLPIR